MITVYRLFSPKRAPWDATGAGLYGGRWNNPGSAILYTASSLSLACLEILVHIRNPANIPVYSYSQLSFPETLVEPWIRAFDTYGAARVQAILDSDVLSKEHGDIWINRRHTHYQFYEFRSWVPKRFRSYALADRYHWLYNHPLIGQRSRPRPVLQVPSMIIPSEWNYLLDPAERFFQERWSKPKPFELDPRLLDPGLR